MGYKIELKAYRLLCDISEYFWHHDKCLYSALASKDLKSIVKSIIRDHESGNTIEDISEKYKNLVVKPPGLTLVLGDVEPIIKSANYERGKRKCRILYDENQFMHKLSFDGNIPLSLYDKNIEKLLLTVGQELDGALMVDNKGYITPSTWWLLCKDTIGHRSPGGTRRASAMAFSGDKENNVTICILRQDNGEVIVYRDGKNITKELADIA